LPIKQLAACAFVACIVLTTVVLSTSEPSENRVALLQKQLLPQQFKWNVSDIGGIPTVDCSSTVSGDPRFWGPPGTKYTVWCPEHCASFGNQNVYGTEIFMDDSVICKAAIARGTLGTCNPGKVSFKLVEPIPSYPAGKNMPTSVGIKEFVEQSSGDEGGGGLCHQIGIETLPYSWAQWTYADPANPKGVENIATIKTRASLGCFNGTDACAQKKAIEKFRWQCTDNKQAIWNSTELAKVSPTSKSAQYVGECYGVRAFQIVDAGQKRECLSLSGKAGSYAEAAATCNAVVAKAADAITVEAWVKDPAPGDGAYVSSLSMGDDKTQDFGFALGSWKGTWAWSVVGTTSADSALPKIARVVAPEYITDKYKGTWTHLAGTYDGTIMRLFINGKAFGCGTSQSGKISFSDKANLIIGALKDFGTAAKNVPVGGDIDEIRIYNKAMDEKDFTADHMGNTIGDGKTVPADLIVYYRFDGQDPKATAGCAETGSACELTFHDMVLQDCTSPMVMAAPTELCEPKK